LYLSSLSCCAANKQGKEIARQASASKGGGKGRATDSSKEKDGEGKFSYLIRLKIFKKSRQGIFSY
jgi:hypothetical protein